jgi:hypothetical protein
MPPFDKLSASEHRTPAKPEHRREQSGSNQRRFLISVQSLDTILIKYTRAQPLRRLLGRALRGICLLPCEELVDLDKAVGDYRERTKRVAKP